MAYVYYMPPAPVAQQEPERPAIWSPQRTGVWGPLLIFAGGASALMIGFFERNPAIIWPVIGMGVVLCAAGVLLARRHVKFWRIQEQERQRAMWRPPNAHQTTNRAGGAGRPEAFAFDLPMYCLEAPSRPLTNLASERSRTAKGADPAGPGGDPTSTPDGGEFWFALGVPQLPDGVVQGHYYLEWAAMTLVVQPHFKYRASGGGAAGTAAATAPSAAAPAASPFAAAAAVVPPGWTGPGGERGAGDTSGGAILTRTGGGGSSRRLTFTNSPADAAASAASDGRRLHAVSLTLMRTPSLGLRTAATAPTSGIFGSPAPGGGTGAGLDRRNGRSSITGRMGDLLSLFTSVAGGGGAYAAAADGGVAAAGDLEAPLGCAGAFGGDLTKPPQPVARQSSPPAAATAAAGPEASSAPAAAVIGIPVDAAQGFAPDAEAGPSQRPSASQDTSGSGQESGRAG